MELEAHIKAVELAVGDPTKGLPQVVFDLVGRLSPVVNVDLLIRNERSETLLTWRHDELYHGWHIPGGVVRFKEQMSHRVAEVARLELGATVRMNPDPAAITQIINPNRNARGHFIAFLYECQLTSPLDVSLRHPGGPPQPGQWAWHASFPPDMIDAHEIYRRFFPPQP